MNFKYTFEKIVDFVENSNLLYKILIVSCVFSYFIYHAIHGNNGYKSYLLVKKSLDVKTAELEQLQQKLEKVKKNVDLLSNKSIDLDMLEERCMYILNYSNPECVILKTRDIK